MPSIEIFSNVGAPFGRSVLVLLHQKSRVKISDDSDMDLQWLLGAFWHPKQLKNRDFLG